MGPSTASPTYQQSVTMVSPEQNRPMIALRSFAPALIALLAVAPAAARAQEACSSICSPQLFIRPGLIRSHVFGGPTVTHLPDGQVSRIPSRTSFQMQLLASATTLIPRTHLNMAVQWLPNASASANPFTEYTAADEGTGIKANTASVALNASVDAVTAKETGGWLGIAGYAGDLFSPAARPGDRSDYTHKLDVGAVATLDVLSWLPASSYWHDVSAYVILDYVATGLPKAGDVVPKGVRRFDTDARPAALLAGLSFRIAPIRVPGS